MTKYPILNINAAETNAAKVLIIYTGGTLGMVFDHKIGSLVPFKFEQILNDLPELKRLGLNLSFLALPEPIDSSNVSPEVWTELTNIIENYYNEYQGFVILHGTDTMAYTASALSFMIQNLTKSIVITGAQLPIGIPRTDARENLITSIEIAGFQENEVSKVPEVCIYFNGKLLRGNRSKKHESSQFDAFESENYPYLGNIGVLAEFNSTAILKIKDNTSPVFYKKLNASVGILKLFPGINEASVKHFLSQKDLKGVVLETYGAGNAPSTDWFVSLIEEAIKSGKTILNVSQCVGGKVLMGKYETSRKLADMGVISGSDMSTEAAITKLMWVLEKTQNQEEIKQLLESNISGELSSDN